MLVIRSYRSVRVPYRPLASSEFNIRVAQRLITVALVFWGLHCIPVALFLNIYMLSTTGQTACGYTNPTFVVYYNRFLFPILLGCLPIVIRVTFALLSFHRVRGMARR